MANAHTFVTQLSNQYSTEKQRIAIARAILKNPPILLLDEATSALDSKSEKLVQDALEKAMQRRTVILIAYKMSTIINADIITVVENGQVTEIGTHSSLLDSSKFYKNLFSIQNIRPIRESSITSMEWLVKRPWEILEKLYIQAKSTKGFAGDSAATHRKVVALASESATNTRTIASFFHEEHILEKARMSLEEPMKRSMKEKTLDQKIEIEPDAPQDTQLKMIKGKIKFQNVEFNYPLRLEVTVSNNFSLQIEPGTKVALVGPSGAGKSSVLTILLRFYDPNQGRVLIDETNIKEYKLKTLRKQIGLVQQEPLLFSSTLRDNIYYGTEQASEAEIVEVSTKANIHEFISNLPDGYNTLVRDKGCQL
ncbi:hypothetical protein J1N35_043258 [Gossypium stocksii]|uniref:ABC transporter domain-containing protein n=1 Tax=Gossypium stocksii TaxID=47602 RepID=A0A9D3ZEU7_9ROSI|nr:hypothetical protein J1N35_043258 [Gossypium stocksii]